MKDDILTQTDYGILAITGRGDSYLISRKKAGSDGTEADLQQRIAALIKTLHTGDGEAAACELAKVGVPAIPALLDYVKEGRHPPPGLEALRMIGEPAVPGIIEILRDVPKVFSHRHTGLIRLLGDIGKPTNGVLPLLKKMLEVSDQGQPGVAHDADVVIHYALYRLGDHSEVHLKALCEALPGSGDPTRRTAAAKCIAQIGPEAKAAVPNLIKLLDDSYSGRHPTEAAKAAAEALASIGPDAGNALPSLKKLRGTKRYKDWSSFRQAVERAISAITRNEADKKLERK